MTQSEREIGRRWFEEVWNKGRREAISEMLAPDGVIHDGGLDAVGPEGFYPFFDRINATFSEMQVTVCHTLAEGDQICVRWLCTGKHTGSGLGIPATGKTTRITGISIFRVADGKAIEAWQNWDMLGLMEQIRGVDREPTYIAAKIATEAPGV